jgi:hypothetical protein
VKKEDKLMDKMIKCQDCGEEFRFSERDQEFYAEKGFQDPKRCHFCRKARKDRHIDKKYNKF